MKKSILTLVSITILTSLLLLAGCKRDAMVVETIISEEPSLPPMVVTSTGIVDGIIDPKYGKNGTQFNVNNMPTYSLPFKVEKAPKGTISYAIILQDNDAYPVTGGFPWTHWTAANITTSEVLENVSQTTTDFKQGANSWMSTQGGQQSRTLSSFYGGMTPPNAPHTYILHVYALNTMLDINNEYYLNELYNKMDGHILAETTLKGIYNN